jgi:hypothetical protein
MVISCRKAAGVAAAQTVGIITWFTDGYWASTGMSWMKMGARGTATMVAFGVAVSSLAGRSAALLLMAHDSTAPSTPKSPTRAWVSEKVMRSKISSYMLSQAGVARSYMPI